MRNRTVALIVGADPFFYSRRIQLATLATRHAIPTIYNVREYAEIGGLMSYGTSLTETFQQVATYTIRILKGAKPADLLSCCRPSSSWSSTCRLRGRSASKFRERCSPAPTR